MSRDEAEQVAGWRVRAGAARRVGCAGALLLVVATFALVRLTHALGGRFAAERVWVAWRWDLTIDFYGTSKVQISPDLPGRTWTTCPEHPGCLRRTDPQLDGPEGALHLSEDPRDASALAWLVVALPVWTLALSGAWVGLWAGRCRPKRGRAPVRDALGGLVLASIPALLFLRWGHQLGTVAGKVWKVSTPLLAVPLPWSLGLTAAALAGVTVLLLQRRLVAEPGDELEDPATRPRSAR